MAAESCSVKYDWYQTDGHVFIALSKRSQEVEHCRVNFSPCSAENSLSPQSIQVFVKEELVFQGKLWDHVQSNKATIKCTPSKIEVRLVKSCNERWVDLLQDSTAVAATSAELVADGAGLELPKKKVQPDWDQMGKQAEQEELDNSDPSTRLFKSIYGGADDETRRAMLKSMQESNGTVLNTNWAEVGKKKMVPYESKDSDNEGKDVEKKN